MLLLLLGSFITLSYFTLASRQLCTRVAISECCSVKWSTECAQPQCLSTILHKCPERKAMAIPNHSDTNPSIDLRRAPQKTAEEPKCGTAQMNYHPCTSKSVANKLFHSCCELYVPQECHFMCEYETDQSKAKDLLTYMSKSKCSFRYLSAILYCASQNRDNRKCCEDLDLNAPQLMVGSRCLRMCDPSGSALGLITKEDVTCLFNWNVMMYCHHSGIREM